MAGDHQVISANDVGLRRSDPEVQNAVESKSQKLSGMFPNKLTELLLLFFHETDFSQLPKSADGLGIVAGMRAACPEAARLFVVGGVHLERKVVANENKLVDDD